MSHAVKGSNWRFTVYCQIYYYKTEEFTINYKVQFYYKVLTTKQRREVK